jgi:hypothetical protein
MKWILLVMHYELMACLVTNAKKSELSSLKFKLISKFAATPIN